SNVPLRSAAGPRPYDNDRPELPPFFFSSRRRHTRWPRDWSSDVCSSDLIHTMGVPSDDPYARKGEPPVWEEFRREIKRAKLKLRSEERRVGKEGDSGWAAAQEREKSEVGGADDVVGAGAARGLSYVLACY